jgi:hypothetical protein
MRFANTSSTTRSGDGCDSDLAPGGHKGRPYGFVTRSSSVADTRATAAGPAFPTLARGVLRSRLPAVGAALVAARQRGGDDKGRPYDGDAGHRALRRGGPCGRQAFAADREAAVCYLLATIRNDA